jgi:hypothetical protein
MTAAENESKILQADEFDRRDGIIGIMSCFLDEVAPLRDGAEEKIASCKS